MTAITILILNTILQQKRMTKSIMVVIYKNNYFKDTYFCDFVIHQHKCSINI